MYQSESFLKEKERIAKSRAAHLRLMVLVVLSHLGLVRIERLS